MPEVKKITGIGSGNVGMSLAVLLAQHNEVLIYDIDIDHVEKINRGESTVADLGIKNFLGVKDLKLTATSSSEAAYKSADLVIVAVPTNYEPDTNRFDTTAVDTGINQAVK